MCNLYLEVNSFIYCKLFKSIVCSHRWMLLCYCGNRVVCWYENRSAAIKLYHVDFHTVMNVVHYCWKECSWLVQKLLSSYETSLIDCLCTLWNVVGILRLEGVQLVPTGPAQLVLSHTVWLFLYTVEFCYIAVGRSAVGCYGNCSAVSLCDCLFKLLHF